MAYIISSEILKLTVNHLSNGETEYIDENGIFYSTILSDDDMTAKNDIIWHVLRRVTTVDAIVYICIAFGLVTLGGHFSLFPIFDIFLTKNDRFCWSKIVKN